MPTTNTLTDAQVRSIKPAPKAAKYFDGGGLHLFVTPSGAKIWRLAYRVAGKPKTMSIGPYPTVGLAKAREEREKAKVLLLAGQDPMDQRRETRKPAADAMTLEKACTEYWAGRKDTTERYREHVRRAFEMHVYPRIGKRPIGAITRDELLEALKPLDAEGKHQYVRKVRMWIAQVWDWAIEHRHAQTNPARAIQPKKAFGAAKVQHFAALELNEVPALIERMSYEAELQSVLAAKLLALTWVRTNELRMWLWSEIDGDLWRIPAGKMKRERDHLVPLSRQAMKLLDVLRARSRGSVYVFPNDLRQDRPMSENAVLYLLGRMGYKGRMTGHGFRSVGSTWANERGYHADAIERQLAHVPKDATRAAYNRAEFFDIRRKMLQDWADWLLPEKAG